MKQTLLLSALAGLALCSPVEKRQDIDFDAYNAIPFIADIAAPAGDAAPQEASYNPTSLALVAAAAATDAPTAVSGVVLATRDDEDASEDASAQRVVVCTTRSANAAPVTSPTDSPDAFLNNGAFAATATAAAQPAAIPSGYALVPEFVNLHASVKDSHYLTYTTKDVNSYTPSICAAKCDAMAGCNGFNIYYERVPLVVSPITQVPDSASCPGLATSPSTTLLKCAFYGIAVKASMATNVGQFQGKFRLVIAGSNSYVKATAPTLPGYEGPVSFGNAAINAPRPVNEHGYLRVQTFGQNVPYDPSLCAASCAAQTDYNTQHNIGLGPCYFFDAYVLYKDGQNGVFTCTYYSTPYGTAFAKNVGQYDSTGAHYTISNSNGYYLDGHYVD